MDTTERKQKRKKSKKGQLILIAVLLILCVAAAGLVIKMAKSRSEAGTPADTAEVDPSEQALEEAGEDVVEDAEESVPESSSSIPVYAYSGTEEDEKYSMPAYDSAVEAGAKYLVLAMVVSNDGTPIVSPDDMSDDLTGYSGYFSGMKDSQIEAITTRGGNPVLKVRDVFDKFGRDVNYVIEIKYTSGRDLQAFTDVVKEYGFEDIVTVSSLYYNVLSQLENEFPDMQKMFLCYDQGAFNVGLGVSSVDIIAVDPGILSEANITAAHDNGKQLGVWVINSEEEIRSAIDLGADLIITENAQLAMTL